MVVLPIVHILTAFVHMVIGIVNVLEEEHQKTFAEDPKNIQMKDLYMEVQALRIAFEKQDRRVGLGLISMQ